MNLDYRQLQADESKTQQFEVECAGENIALKSSALLKNILHLLTHADTLYDPPLLWRCCFKFLTENGQ